MTDQDRKAQEDTSAAQTVSQRSALACGNQLCLRCHEECEVVMAAYLGLDEKDANL